MSFGRSPLRLAANGPQSGERPTLRPVPPRRPSGIQMKAPLPSRSDPLEGALLTRPVWDSRRPEPAIHEILYRLSVGDDAGAIAAADALLEGKRVPALTVSADVLDELELDGAAAQLLAHVDGLTPLSRVLYACHLERACALRTLCDLVERRIVVLRGS
jgi:hypothetical protein